MVKRSTAFVGAAAAGTVLTASQVFVPTGVTTRCGAPGDSLRGAASNGLQQSSSDGSSLHYCAAAAVCAAVGAAAAKQKSRVTTRAAKDDAVAALYDESKITGKNVEGYIDWDSSGGLITGFALEFGPIGKMQPEAMKEFAGGIVGSELAGFGGSYKFDPLALSARWPEHLAWWREAELKHARVAMLAFVGLLAPDVVRLPFEQCADPDLNFVNAHNQLIEGLGFGPMWWLLTVVGALESVRFKQLGMGFEDLTLENAGDLGLFKLPEDPEQKLFYQIAELKNGRLAMMAVSGIFTAGVLWGEYHFPFYPFN